MGHGLALVLHDGVTNKTTPTTSSSLQRQLQELLARRKEIHCHKVVRLNDKSFVLDEMGVLYLMTCCKYVVAS